MPIDVQSILQILLAQGREDVIAWHYNRSGMFSVRSSYHCQWTAKFDDGASNAVDNGVWKRLWKLSIPGKIKIYGWRILNGLIPCKGILLNRHVVDSVECPLCQSGVEDIKHMMFTCNRAKAVWSSLGVWSQIERLTNGDRSGQQMTEEAIRSGGTVPHLKMSDGLN